MTVQEVFKNFPPIWYIIVENEDIDGKYYKNLFIKFFNTQFAYCKHYTYGMVDYHFEACIGEYGVYLSFEEFKSLLNTTPVYELW